MTKKDYELIAATFKEGIEFCDTQNYGLSMRVLKSVAMRMATAPATTNSRFDRERFLKACGVTE